MKNIKFQFDKLLFSIALAACFSLLIYLHETSSYILMDIPTPLSDLPNGEKWRELYISQHFLGEYGRILILRKEARAYGEHGAYTFDTPENVIKYFDDQLVKRNWIRSHVNPYYQCQYGLPEKNITARLQYKEYVRNGDNSKNATTKICVAVITRERLSWENFDTFEVLLISIRYSPITEFLEPFRNW